MGCGCGDGGEEIGNEGDLELSPPFDLTSRRPNRKVAVTYTSLSGIEYTGGPNLNVLCLF